MPCGRQRGKGRTVLSEEKGKYRSLRRGTACRLVGRCLISVRRITYGQEGGIAAPTAKKTSVENNRSAFCSDLRSFPIQSMQPRTHAAVFSDLTVKVFSARKFSRLLFETSFSPARRLAYCFIPPRRIKGAGHRVVPVLQHLKAFPRHPCEAPAVSRKRCGHFCVSSHGLSALNLRCAWITATPPDGSRQNFGICRCLVLTDKGI